MWEFLARLRRAFYGRRFDSLYGALADTLRERDGARADADAARHALDASARSAHIRTGERDTARAMLRAARIALREADAARAALREALAAERTATAVALAALESIGPRRASRFAPLGSAERATADARPMLAGANS